VEEWKQKTRGTDSLETIHAVILSLLMTGFGFWVGVWIATHHFD
jgi:hypothetical protein